MRLEPLEEHQLQRVVPGTVAAAPRKTGRTIAITAMTTTEERDAIDRAAHRAGLSRAAWARQTLLSAANHDLTEVPDAPPPSP